MKNFKKLKIWQKGFQIASKSFSLVKSFPKEEKFGISSQITRAAVSIPSNIAEGNSRAVKKIKVGSLKFHWDHLLNLKPNS